MLFLLTRFDLDWRATWAHLGGSNPWWYLLGLLTYYGSFLIRGWRWHLLLSNARAHSGGNEAVPSPWVCARFILMGWFANSVTWFRLGDAYRAYLVAEESSASFSQTAGTVLAERILDMALVFLVLLGTVALLSAGGQLGGAGIIVLIAFILVAAGALALFIMWRFGLRMARLLPGTLERAYQRFHQGTLGSFQRLPLLALLGLLGWACEVGRLYFVLQALGFALSAPLIIFVALANALLTTVPFTPGGLGIVEPGIVGLLRLRLSAEAAVSAALLDRSISYLSVILTGGALFLGRELWRRRRRNRATSEQERSQGV